LSLPEVLVTVVVVGALTAVAVPAFRDQSDKGSDAEAKSAAVMAAKAIEDCAAERGGRYELCSKEALLEIQPSLMDVADRLVVQPGLRHYEIGVTSRRDPNVSFRVFRATDGSTTRTCTTNEERGGCLVPTTGTW
jgi:type II secretory pathway pseudopilin PulG